VLCSGGLDSAVLLAAAARSGPVQPVYVGVGFAWESEERAAAERVVAAMREQRDIAPLVSLQFDMTDVFPESHWAVRGTPPAYDTPDEDVYLDGRNIILLAKTSVFMARRGISRVYLGQLCGNPFPDATPGFFAAMAQALSAGLGHAIVIEAPFLALTKEDVIRKGLALGVPMELTLSCMKPSEGRHCGACSKCRERHLAFRTAQITDAAKYLTP
jgi:7-cyano-7-deazaguanine synthase